MSDKQASILYVVRTIDGRDCLVQADIAVLTGGKVDFLIKRDGHNVIVAASFNEYEYFFAEKGIE